LRCLDPHARRAAIASSRAVPLTRAVRAAKARHPGELVGARLCESGGTLVYVLTLLSQNGKVTRTTVDAATGRVVGRR